MHLCMASSIRAMPEKEKPPAMRVDLYCVMWRLVWQLSWSTEFEVVYFEVKLWIEFQICAKLVPSLDYNPNLRELIGFLGMHSK